jgi:hypothetical protein
MTGRTVRNPSRLASWLLAATLAAAAYAAVVIVTGGFDTRLAGIRLRSRDWVRPAAVAAAGAAWLLYASRRPLAAASTRAWERIDEGSGSRILAGLAMAWTLAAALAFGTFAVGGADSYGYAAQARLLLEGRLTDTIRLEPSFRWPDAPATLIPLGFTASRRVNVIAPRYPPGLPLLMALFGAISERGIYLVVPLFGLLAVWCTYQLGATLGDRLAGAAAALLVAASPTFLYQLVQPMGDVPAAAGWLAALLAASRGTVGWAGLAGTLASLAIAIRPNLAPLAGLIFISAVNGAPQPSRVRRGVVFIAALAPFVIATGWIQYLRYGSALASGYGTIDQGFSVHNVLPNLARYPRWLTEAHTVFIWTSAFAPIWIVTEGRRRPAAAWTALFVALAVWAAYLPYAYFQPHEWFYTRFLLPAVAIMLLYSALVSLSVVRRLPAAVRLPIGGLLMLALLATFIQCARSRQVFDLERQERRYPEAGTFVREQLPSRSFILAAQHSGSLRYYANRPTLRWDLLSASHLDEALAELRAAGYEPFAVLDGEEDAAFRRRFDRAGAIARLKPLAVLGGVRVYGFTR